MFEVITSPIGRFNCHRLINTDTQEYLEVLTSFGAGVNDLVVFNGRDELLSIIDGYRSENEIVQDHHSKFKGSKLSPYPNRVKEGKYVFDGESYQLPINEVVGNNNLHAFLHNRSFDVVSTQNGDSEARIVLNYDFKGEEQGYPFFYRLELTYIFGEKGIEVLTTIINTDNKTIPMGDGWHPYFHFGNGIKKVEMKFGSANRLSSNMGNELGDISEFENGEILEDLEIDDCFEISEQASSMYELSLTDVSNAICITIAQDCDLDKYKYFQVYTPPSRKQIAIEPVTCPPNAMNTGEGLIRLQKDEKIQMKFKISVKGA